jgi:hypothetical protein
VTPEEENDDAYRAIGRYVVEFSDLVREMRDIVCEYVSDGVTDMHVSSLLLGEATAQVVANAFFGICRLRGELDADEDAVWRVFRKQTNGVIQRRNDIAHGDWQIGNVRVDETGDLTSMPPRLVRIMPTRMDGPYRTLDLTVEEIDQLSDEIEGLHAAVQDFGHLALKLPVFHTASATGSVVSKGEYRVRDVFTVTSGKAAQAQVLRNGPRADALFAGVYSKVMRNRSTSN